MADVKLSNTATIVGNYDAIPTTLDPTLIKLVEDTVQVNGAKADYTYDADTGLLIVFCDENCDFKYKIKVIKYCKNCVIGYKICMIVIEKQTRKKYKIRLKL